MDKLENAVVENVVYAEEGRACSLCGRPAGVGDGSGAAWVLCADCEGTDAARAAGFTHDQEVGWDFSNNVAGGDRVRAVF